MSELAGEGTRKNPYEITCFEDLDKVRNNLSACYTLSDNIDASKSQENGFIPIGTLENPFMGVFDGNDYTITSLTINVTNSGGLFGAVEKGKIKNITIDDMYMSGEIQYDTGSITSRNDEGILSNVTVAGKINNGCSSGETYGATGGLVGKNFGKIVNSTFKGSIRTDVEETGGIVGYNGVDGVISGSVVNGVVKGRSYIGGIAGKNYSKVKNCCFVGGNEENINSDWHVIGVRNVGGIVGYNYIGGEVDNSCFIGKVLRNEARGNITGQNIGDCNGLIEIETNTYNNNTRLSEMDVIVSMMDKLTIKYKVEQEKLFVEACDGVYVSENVSVKKVQQFIEIDCVDIKRISGKFRTAVVTMSI